MKKLIALLVAILMCLSVFPAAAAEAYEPSAVGDSEATMDNIGELSSGYEVFYDTGNPVSDVRYERVIGSVFFDTDTVELGIYVYNGESYVALEQAYGTVIGDDDMDEVLTMINGHQSIGYEAFAGWNVFYNYEDEPTELPTEPGEDILPTEAPTLFPTEYVTDDPSIGGNSGDTDIGDNAPEGSPDPPDEPGGAADDNTEPLETDPPAEEPPVPTECPTEAATQAPTIVPPFPTEAPTATPSPAPTKENESKIIDDSTAEIVAAAVKAGKTFVIHYSNPKNKKVSFTSTNKSVVKVSSKGKVTALKKGFAFIILKIGKSSRRISVSVVSSPRLSKSSLRIKRGSAKTIKIIGKAASVRNKYKNTKYAKITSKRTAKKLRIKALRRGKTTLKIRVNGLVLKLKVKIV